MSINLQDRFSCADSGEHGKDLIAAAGKGDPFKQGANFVKSSDYDPESCPASGTMSIDGSSQSVSDGSPRAASPESEGMPSPGGNNYAPVDLCRSSSEETLAEDLFLVAQADAAKNAAKHALSGGISPALSDQGGLLPDFPTDGPRSMQPSTDGFLCIRFQKQKAQYLKALARDHDVDLNIVLLAAWVAVLSRLSGQSELIITLQGFAPGLQVSSVDASPYLSIRVDLSGDPSTERLLKLIKEAALGLTAPRSLNQTDLSTHHQVLFSWYNEGQSSNIEALGSSGALQVGFDVELHLQDVDDQIIGALRFATALFDPSTIERHLGYFSSILEGMVSNATQPVSRINILSPAERMLLLDTWNSVQASNQEFPTIHQFFEEQVKLTPEAVALVHEDQELTYVELNARSNSLAHRLIELGVRPDICVPICVGRSIAMVIGVLAILKAGGAYVPMDPTYPRERLTSILADATPSLIVIDDIGRATLGEESLRSLILVDPNMFSSHQTTNPWVPGLGSRHLAYIIYTSGSTGKPKGVVVEHRGIADLIRHYIDFYAIRDHSRVLQLASISFDVSAWEIFLSMSSGLTLYLAPDSIRMDRDKLWHYMSQHSITLVTCTPSFLQDGKGLPTWPTTTTQPLTLVLGGEALNANLLHNLIGQGITVFNDYGPTEASISAASWKCPMDYDGDTVPIGKPVRNARLYVLDVHQQPAPVGAVGELYIGGIGVARGYLNMPVQTAERFLLDPFCEHDDGRMYRTGDLVRRLADGNLVYVGRTDYQVKIRGFRIELGEIEACLSAHEWVSEAVVLALGSSDDQQLVAYVVSEPQDNLPRHLRSHLAAKLPQYMVPAAYVRLDAMPLTANDKLDRKALPAPVEESFAREEYEAPQGDIENRLADIWTQLLQIKSVGRHDNFFALGGHSLLAAKMLDHLRRVGLTVPLRALFQCPTLSALAMATTVYDRVAIPPNLITLESNTLTPEMLPLVDLNQNDLDSIISKIPGGLSNIQDIYSLSPLQEGILFHHLLATEGDPYLLTSTIAFESRILLDRYLSAFQAVVDRHDILRTSFFWENLSSSAQVVHRNAPLPVEEIVLDSADGDITEQLDRRFNPKHYRIDLCQAPLLRFIIAKDACGRWLLVQLIHHLIGDHDAEEEMHAEIKTLLDGQGGSLPKPRSFRDHLAQVRLGSSPEADEKFFRGMLAEVDEPTLPFGLIKVDNGGAEVKEAHQILSQDLNHRLRVQAKRLRVNLATLCHVAWAQVLARTSGQQNVVFGTVLSGRLQVGDGSGHALGLSMNTLPFRCDIDKRSALECVQDTHSRLTALLEHEHASLALAQRCSSVPVGTPLFSGLLNYRHSTPPSNTICGASNAELVSQEGWFEYPGLQFLSSQERTNYPFGLSVDDFGTDLGLTVKVVHPFNPARVCAYMREAMKSLTAALESDISTPVETLEVLPTDERQMLLREWNLTHRDYPDLLCLQHLFEQQAERTPDAIAVVHGNLSVTYAELNNRANHLAHKLIQLGVKPDSLVAICAERSPAMIIGILAILKAGGAYVPLDPFYSSDRLRDVINDAAPSILLADNVGRQALGNTTLASLTVLDPNTQDPSAARNPRIIGMTSQHLAYVIYTSGSTGKPKGVMIEHRGVVNLITFRSNMFEIHPRSRVLQFTSLSFDHSVSEIFTTLTRGASLHLVHDDIRLDRQRLWDLIQQSSISHVSFTPSLLQDCKNMPVLDTLRTLVVMGEALPPTLPAVLRRIAPCSSIFNGYGPTEISISASVWKCPMEFREEDVVSIGRPLPNKSIYLLDVHGDPVPLGAIGEMYVGGVGVARGYLNQPGLTSERFVLDPFSEDSNARMYRTGDMARYLPDGNLVCLGRCDHQVKIRGFRIELGEIEAQLAGHPIVSESVVVAPGEGSNKRLIAYVVVRHDALNNQNLQEAQLSSAAQRASMLRSYLRERLPEYMVPAAFVHLDALPLTSNGKLDRRALPDPGEDDFARQEYEAPQGGIESALASIWTDLLHVERVSRHDSFFALGGHSLLAVQLVSRLHRLGHSISVRSLFESPTLSVLAQSIGLHRDVVTPPNLITRGTTRITPEMLPLIDLNQTDIDLITERVPGGVANVQDIYALSPLQDGILFHHLMAKSGDPYVLYTSLSFDTRATLDQYLAAVEQIVNRHDVLRTSFLWQDLSTPAQVVMREAPLSITELKLDPAAGPIAEQLKQMFDPRSHRMDLTQAPLLRFIAAQESDGRWILFGLQHHLVGDHSTLDIMLTEIQTFCKGAEGALPPAQPYRNLIAQARLGVSQEEHEKFFKEMLAEVDTPSLPFDITDIHGDGIQVSEVERTLPQDLNNRLRWQARRLGISVASLCHVAWAQVIERTSGQQRVVFGTVLFGRMQAATSLDGAMGLFINTLPIRVDLDTDNVEGTVRATHARLAGLLEHEHASLALAQHCSGVAAGAPLFSSLLNYRHNSTSSNDYEAMKGMKLLESEERTNYPFCLSVEDYGTSLGLTAQVVQPLDPGRICGYMQQALDSLADALEHNPSMSVANLEVIPKCELQMLLRDWNITQEDDPDHHCIHHWFEHQVEHTPEAIAVVYKDQSLTYGELNERANRLAYRLVKLGVQPDSLVAICVERSLGMIIGILAILKAGGAYVPLDPAHASERLLGILSDASPSILVADTYGTAAVAEADLSMLTLVDPNGAYEGPTINPRIPTLSSHHLAYVIYTSGSTGKPKGCMVEHRQVVRLFTTTADWYNFNQQDTWCLFHSFAFDFSVWEIWGALRVGGRVVIAPQDTVRSLQDLRHLIHEHSITVLNTTPSIFTSLIECDIGDGLCDSLRYLIFGGEPLAPAVLQSWFTRPVKNRTQAVHVYGITETTVLATHRRMIPEDCTLPSLPIGLRFNDLRMYVLDNRGQPVPIGAVGELYVGGAGVTRGYLNRPELTAERFLRDPFVEDPEARMYRSGDLVRYLPDGNLVYVGRNDHQVKLRGFRIELGEIQARLSEHPLVSDCVVLVIGEEDNKRLVAYVAAKPDVQSVNGTDGETLQLALALRTHLAARLPEYMVPSAFVQLDALPLNGNGKVDRRALPEPSHDSLAREAFEEPQGEIEVALAAIWADLLRLDRVSRHDSFFALGGHSLLAVRMMNRVATLGANVPLTTLFASPCLYAFADEIKSPLGEKSTHLPPIEPVPRTEMMPLSFEQQRMWFLAQLDGVSDTYHVPMAMRLRGVLNREAFQRAMSDLFERHEALRSVFVDVNGQSYMRILTPEGIHVEYIDLQHEVDINGRVAELVAKEIHTSFDLVQGPLIRATIIQTAHNDHVLVLNQHHIISDGWSIAIMTRELSQLYSAYVNGGSNPLPPLEVQYPDYAAWQRQWFSGDRLKSQADYWRSALAGVPVLIDLPTDRPRPPRQSFAGSRVPIAVDAELTTSLKRLSQKHGVTMFMTILAAWSVVLSRLSGQDDIVIGTPTANRGRHEIETMIGLFVNTLALRVDLSAEPTMRNLLDRVRRSTLAAYEHQDIPFEQVVEIVQPPRRMDHTPLFQVMFSWQNTEVDEWIMPGLQADAFNLDYEVLKYDLELDLYEENGEIVGSLSYSTALFDQTTIERYIGYLHTTLQTLSDNVDQSIASIDILSPAERTLLLQTWNATHQDPPTNECIHRLFEKQVQRLPQAVALVHGEVALTYTELNERANQLAHLLIELGVHPDARVAICVERSLAMVIGTLAILKAGGAFVPLDPAYASERLRTILMDAAPTVLIADSAGLAALGQANLSSMTVVDPNRPLSYASTNTHAPGLTSRHLAYIIYTSGSTGKPKGVMIEHRGVSDLAQTHTKFCGIREGSRVMQFASFSFDASVWDIMLPLSSGGALYLPPDCIRMDRDALWNYMAKHSITLASFTPSFLQDGKDLPPLNNPLTLVLGGEALSQTLLQNLIRQGITVINDYGPTEVTVSAATWRCPQEFHDNVVPIGRPVIHSRLYLLDLYRQPVPLGAVGELYVGGVAVARGYLNRPELTNEMFIPDPYADEMDAKMYRTGDLARYLPDGNLVYLGRKDNQVKIRGFRIELGEIEAVLLEHHAVSEAVVLVLGEANDKRLVAYVVLSEPLETLTRQLRAHVSAHLPRYMVPETFVRLDTMPLTSNDKLDRKALPTPEYTSLVSETYEIPLDGQIDITLDPTQLAIHTIWKQLLPSSPTWIPLTENFFDLGGHSILATRLIFEVRRVCCVDVPLSLIFREPTIGGMAKEVDRMSMDSVELEEADKSSSSSKETAVADQEEEFDYSGDFEELCRTEIDAVYGRVERQDKVDHQTFFLTGATGFLGTFILSNLLSTNPTARVICLARASSEEKALDRVRACGEAHLTWNEEWIASGRLLVVAGDLSLERFGLSQETWDKCCRQVDIIIHNGALVNGVFPYTNLRAANVLGTLQGIKMASTYHTKSFHFVSSTSVLDTTHYRELSSTLARTTNRGVPETDDLEGARHGLDSGYGQSKWVAEKLIMAANKNGLPATIIRPGYILGHTRTGVTNTGDFIWRLIKGCVEVGSAPSMNAAVNICPVDYVAQCVVSVATSPGSEAVMVYQVTHPTASPFRFNDFFQILNRYGYEVLAADYSSWRRALTDRAIKSQDTALYTLLHMVMDDQMGTTESPELSDVHTQRIVFPNSTFDATPRMNTELVGRYLAFMIKIGFLNQPILKGENILALPDIEDGN